MPLGAVSQVRAFFSLFTWGRIGRAGICSARRSWSDWGIVGEQDFWVRSGDRDSGAHLSPVRRTFPQGILALPTDKQFKHHKRYLGITMTNLYLARMMPRIAASMQELIDLWALGSKRLPPQDGTYPIPALDDIRLPTIHRPHRLRAITEKDARVAYLCERLHAARSDYA
ncbi:hypothetical protein C8R43DRAFT_1016811 [Mycena crocata]|nr:hypothetical protein C8R43DRAFT_1016811 [Mycena crocata]